jgi:hypothetical protein
MSGGARRKQPKQHPATVNAMVDDAAWRQSPQGSLERKKAEFRAIDNERTREWLANYLESINPEPGQKGDGLLGSKVGFLKGTAVSEPLLFCRISKAVPLDDGSLEVHGIASSEQRDSQNEIVRADAIRAALPEYLRFPAVRLQHQQLPIGKTVEVDVGKDRITRVVTRIYDRDAITKVRAQVLRGFSLGGHVTQRDEEDPTVITGLVLNEISLCDSPANRSCEITLWKADMPEPRLCWHCGTAGHAHTTQVEAAFCRMERDSMNKLSETKRQKKLAKSAEKHAAELEKQWAAMSSDERCMALLKASHRRPAVGDAGLISFLRHGRP